MAIRVAINGFGRIGRLVLRAAIESGRKDVEFVAINDLGSCESSALLLQYDSVHGPLKQKVTHGDDWIDAGTGKIQVTSLRNPADLSWKELDIDVVMECTGIFASKDKASAHLIAGAKRVLVSAPCTDADITVVYGVNDHEVTDAHKVISNASCTTNCLAPPVYVLNKKVGLEKGYMTTVHSFTGDQQTVDTHHSDPRRARAASLNIIPTSTGAARAVGLVLPELKGRLDGTALRVPTPNVSLVDLKFVSKRATTVEEINDAIIEAASAGSLHNIMITNDAPLVSSDFNHNPASSIFDLTQTQVIDGNLVRILTWYDNEWGFSNRMSDLAAKL